MEKHPEKAILIKHLQKNFLVTERESGLRGSIKSFITPTKKVVTALKDISFSIAQGELVGFIGPNGAGKTTALKVLSGLLYPTRGLVNVLGYNPWDRKPEYLKQISLVMGQKNQLWWDLPAVDTLELNKAIYEIPDREYRLTLDALTELLEAKDLLKIQVRRLSLGQRMRLELIAALIHKPKILYLDEPTIGLDVVAQQKIRDFIEEYNRINNATVLLTSHDMDDLINLTKRVIVIDKGEIIFDGFLKELVNQYAEEKIIHIYLKKDIDLKLLEKVGRIISIQLPQVTLSVARNETAIAASELLQNFPIMDLTIEEESIEDIIRRVFRQTSADKG